jgi:hypothetical protein
VLPSLKQRMTTATDPSERVMSASPTGDWLNSLRASFDPEAGKKKPDPDTTPGLIPGQLRAA